MTPEIVIDVFSNTLWVVIMLVSIIIIPGLIVGLLVAMFQAATQINEMTLNFIPRLLVTLLALIIAGPWLIQIITEFTTTLFSEIPLLIG